MNLHRESRSTRRACCGIFSALLAVLGGCAATGPRSGDGLERDEIVDIRQYYQTPPWLYDEDGRIAGSAPRVYFVAQSERPDDLKGYFVPGAITATLYVLRGLPDGNLERQRVYEWTFDRQRARDFRIPTPSIMGLSYGLVLRWPAELNLADQEVQFTISYTRAGGQSVSSRSPTFRVPRGVMRAPAGRPGAASQPARSPAGAPR